jgi:hypothetical protein
MKKLGGRDLKIGLCHAKSIKGGRAKLFHENEGKRILIKI